MSDLHTPTETPTRTPRLPMLGSLALAFLLLPSTASAQDGLAVLPLPDRATPRRAVARAARLELFQPVPLANGTTQLVAVGARRLPLSAGAAMPPVAVVTGPRGIKLPKPTVLGDGTNAVFPTRGQGLPLGPLATNMQRTATFVVIAAPEDVEDRLGNVTVIAGRLRGSVPLKYLAKDETETSTQSNQAPKIRADSYLVLERGRGRVLFTARDPEGKRMFPSARGSSGLSVKLTRGAAGNQGELTITSSDPDQSGTVVLVITDAEGAFSTHTIQVMSEKLEEEDKTEGEPEDEDGTPSTDHRGDEGNNSPETTTGTTPDADGSGSGQGSSSRGGRSGAGIIGVLETELGKALGGSKSKP